MTPNPTHPCPTCLSIELSQKMADHDHDAGRAADTHDWAQQHVELHDAGLAKGEMTQTVKEIANDNKGGTK